MYVFIFSFHNCGLRLNIQICHIYKNLLFCRPGNGVICLSRSDLKIDDHELKETTRTNYNKLVPVKNRKIYCYSDGEYNLTELCYNYEYGTAGSQFCTLATGQRIVLNPR